MAIIPERLHNKDINFVVLVGKKPIQENWTNKELKYDSQELIEHIKQNNYGVRGGKVGDKYLLIVDFDDEKIQDEVVKKMPETFTVKTGSGKLHKYFYSNKGDSFKIFDKKLNTLADIQGEGKQVVGPESIHPNGNKYILLEDKEIAYIDYSELQALLLPYDERPKKEEPANANTINYSTKDNFLTKLQDTVTMNTILNSFKVDTNRNPTSCLFHASKGGHCLGFNEKTAHCFHCEKSWNIFSLVKDVKSCSFKEALDYIAGIAGLQDELEKSREEYIKNMRDDDAAERYTVKATYYNYMAAKAFSNATELLVNYILEHNYIYTTKDDEKSEIWIYREGVYIPNGRSEIKIILREILEEKFSMWIYNQIIAKIEPDTFIESKIFFGSTNIEEIAVENGILNIRSRNLSDFSPKKIFFSKMPVKYDDTKICKKIDEFLASVLANSEDKKVFYEIGGYTLLDEYIFEKAFILVGDGRNGKDKSLELIKRLIGANNCCSVPLSSLKLDSFIIGEFFGKKANIAGEIGNQDLKDTSAFKALTGRSIITAPRKFLNGLTFQNSAKFIFACNNLPMVYDNSLGFWDRWVLLLYPYTFVDEFTYKNTKDKEINKIKLRDEYIIDKITTEEEMSGLLNAFLDGLDRLIENKKFSSTAGSEEIKSLWIKKSNSFMAFCLEKIDYDSESYTTRKEIRQKYATYCKSHKLVVKSDIVIKRTLEEIFGSTEGNKFINYSNERVWEGIKLK